MSEADEKTTGGMESPSDSGTAAGATSTAASPPVGGDSHSATSSSSSPSPATESTPTSTTGPHSGNGSAVPNTTQSQTAPENAGVGPGLNPIKLIGAAVKSFAPSSVAPFARRNYRYELPAMMVWPFVLTMIEGAVTGVIAKKAFPFTPDWVVATLMGAPAFSSITSFFWTKLAEGKHLVTSLMLMHLAITAMVLTMAFLPLNDFGLYVFTFLAVFSRVGMVGVITLRSVLWRANYERHERARITGKLITLPTLLVAVLSLAVGRAMDINEQSFRYIFIGSTVFGVITAAFVSRLRVRRPFLVTPSASRDLAASDQGRMSVIGSNGTKRRSFWSTITKGGMAIANAPVEQAVPAAGRAIRSWGQTIRDMMEVLKNDRVYRGYMLSMFVLGLGNLSINAPLVLVITDRLKLDYLGSLLLLQSIPLVCIPITIPLWARLLDRMHVIRFRAIHGWVFVIAQFFLCTGAIFASVPLVAMGQVVRGIGFGGGALAWNIGHNDFATTDKAGLYMTIHVTLTGLRAFLGAYIAIWIYSGLTLWGFRLLVPMGDYSFIFWGMISLAGVLGFVNLSRKNPELSRAHPPAAN
jgi:hypothetical protein